VSHDKTYQNRGNGVESAVGSEYYRGECERGLVSGLRPEPVGNGTVRDVAFACGFHIQRCEIPRKEISRFPSRAPK
jgi:hypothetical protein